VEIIKIHRNFDCGFLNRRINSLDAHKKGASNDTCLKYFSLISRSCDRSNIVAVKNLPLGCVHIGGKSKYAISCVSPTAACPTSPPSVAYTLYLRDRRTGIDIAALCARHSFRLTGTAAV
jgi:hypothetical protein